MAVDAANIKARFPEFAALDDAFIERWIEEASRSHNVVQWGGKSDDGLAYLTAHLMVYVGNADVPVIGGGLAGPLKSQTEGDVSGTVEVPKAFTNNDLGTTKYGRRYLSLLGTLFVKRCT